MFWKENPLHDKLSYLEAEYLNVVNHKLINQFSHDMKVREAGHVTQSNLPENIYTTNNTTLVGGTSVVYPYSW